MIWQRKPKHVCQPPPATGFSEFVDMLEWRCPVCWRRWLATARRGWYLAWLPF